MTVIEVCHSQGPRITGITHQDQPISGASILWVIAGLESTFGARFEYVKRESAYAKGGTYYNPDLWRRYGDLSACSLGAWQVMLPTAIEYGFKDSPWRLVEDHLICGYWATEYILRRSIERDHATTLHHILDSYNSGNHRDQRVPEAYIARGFEIYRERPLPPS